MLSVSTRKCPYCENLISLKKLESHKLKRCPKRPILSDSRRSNPDGCKSAVPVPLPPSRGFSHWVKDEIKRYSKQDQFYARRMNKIRCPDCLDWISQACVERHYQDHRFDSARRTSPWSSEWRGCLLCADVFRGEEALEKHHYEHHQNVWPTERHLRGRPLVNSASMTRKSEIPNMRIWRTIHRADPAADLKETNPARQHSSLDATVRFAHAYRDGGFGSHPSYDDMGEESTP